jgi:hypothetical protein
MPAHTKLIHRRYRAGLHPACITPPIGQRGWRATTLLSPEILAPKGVSFPCPHRYRARKAAMALGAPVDPPHPATTLLQALSRMPDRTSSTPRKEPAQSLSSWNHETRDPNSL